MLALILLWLLPLLLRLALALRLSLLGLSRRGPDQKRTGCRRARDGDSRESFHSAANKNGFGPP